MEKNRCEKIAKAAKALRILSACAVELAGSGHPGMPLGFADVFTTLVAQKLKFNPKDPKWLGRDRLVLSAGHGSMLLYAFYYLTHYKNFSIEDIKNFRQLFSKTPGHPERCENSPVEITTGPLGQGFASSVGMAIAAKKYLQKTNSEIAGYKIYTVVGDGCLMEGISYEAASIAGHLNLNNLIVLFDSNNITIDGPTDLAISENQQLKFQSLGWETCCVDGHNISAVDKALSRAQKSHKPFFIECKTTIGYGCKSKSNSCESHGSPLGPLGIAELKEFLEWSSENFVIPQDILDIWKGFALEKKDGYKKWHDDFEKLTLTEQNYFEPAKFEQKTIRQIEKMCVNDDEATRFSAGKIIEVIAQKELKVILGSADLSNSTSIYGDYCKVITKDDFSGNFIHYGVREGAMASIMNGLAIEGFLPIGGTFLAFSDYMKPGIRMACLMELNIIYLMTHDSIGLGEDGPTHQPVEQLAGLRSTPNLSVFRPADSEETIGAFVHACSNLKSPALMVLSRQKIKSTLLSKRNQVEKGAYFIVKDCHNPDISIFATGSEVYIAKEVRDLLIQKKLKINLISAISFSTFWQQDQRYIKEILAKAKIKVAIEAGSSYGWHKLIGSNGLFFGVETFGMSATCADLYKHFGLTAENIYEKIMKKYENRN